MKMGTHRIFVTKYWPSMSNQVGEQGQKLHFLRKEIRVQTIFQVNTVYSFPAGYKVTVHEYYQFLHEMISNDTRCSSVIRWPNWVQCFSSVLSELSSLITQNRIFPQNKATECDVIILFNNTTLFPWLIVCYLLLHQLTLCSLWKTSLIQSSSVIMITLSILLLFLLER